MNDAIHFNDHREALEAGAERRWVQQKDKALSRLLGDEEHIKARCMALQLSIDELRQQRGTRAQSLAARVTFRPGAHAENKAYVRLKDELRGAQESLAYTQSQIKEEQKEITDHRPVRYDERDVPLAQTYTADDLRALHQIQHGVGQAASRFSLIR